MLDAMRLSDLAESLSAELQGQDCAFASVSTDSRSIAAGQLFVALSGPRFDGHAYLEEVACKGAVGALVERHVPDVDLPQLRVADTRQALGQLGALNRAAFSGPLVAVTGSSGKTSVKEMLASILRAARGVDAVLATRGNLNNDLGVPLTLLELAPQHQAAVIELGASRLGEIAYTVTLAQPDVSLITNAGTAHIGEFGGVEKIVEAKGEILEGLSSQGTAVLNRDDAAWPVWLKRAAGRSVLSFSLHDTQADFHAGSVGRDQRGCVNFTLAGPAGLMPVQLNLLGEHNIANALAASAAAHAVGVAPEHIVAGLQAVQPVAGRCVVQMLGSGVRLIDDSYNANPASMQAATDVLASFTGRKLLVLGDMGELGDWAEQSHAEVGGYAAGKVDALWAVGPLMKHAVEAFGPAGRHFDDQQSLIEALQQEQGNTTILIKGSRSAAMDRVVMALGESSMESH